MSTIRTSSYLNPLDPRPHVRAARAPAFKSSTPPWGAAPAPSLPQLAHARAQQLDAIRPQGSAAPRGQVCDASQAELGAPGLDHSTDRGTLSISESDAKWESTVLPPSEDTINDDASGVFAPTDGALCLMSRAREVAFVAVTCLAQFLSLGGLNQTVSPMLVLARQFGVEDYGTLSWFSASYSLTVGTFILPAGKASLLRTALPHRMQGDSATCTGTGACFSSDGRGSVSGP